MTDQKQRLRALDRLDTPDVWERARNLEPSGAIDRTIEHAARKRVVVIVVAFAVFAAAATFAWQGFRSSPGPAPASQPDAISSTVLWPERTQEGLDAAQAAADAGDPATLWRTDPGRVALRFAEDIMGWGAPGGSYGVAILSETPPIASVQATLTRFAIPCPSPAPGTAPTCPPPYENETLTMRQEATTGPTGVWSVTEVRASDLNLQPGEPILNGVSVDGSARFPDTAASVRGFAAATGIHVGADAGCSIVQQGEAQQGSDSNVVVAVPPDAMAGTACGSATGGYAWLATTVLAARTDPLDFVGDQPSPTFYGLTLIPLQVTLPENGSPK